jgi:hypothetical protein
MWPRFPSIKEDLNIASSIVLRAIEVEFNMMNLYSNHSPKPFPSFKIRLGEVRSNVKKY